MYLYFLIAQRIKPCTVEIVLKELCYGNNMCSYIHKHICLRFWKKIHPLIKDIYISRKLPFHIKLNNQREEAKNPNAQKSEPCLLEAWEIHTNWTIEQYKKYINRYFNIKTERYKEQLDKKTKYINSKF